MPGIGIGLSPHEILQTMSVGPPPFKPVIGDMAFTPYMAKRAGQGPFAAAPIVQGDFDGSGQADRLTFPRGNLIGNQVQLFYANADPYQGSVTFWWTPEKDRDATQTNDEFLFELANSNFLAYEHDNQVLRFTYGGQTYSVAHTTVAGTTYQITLRWDTTNTLDGTNYACISIDDAHTFGISTAPTVPTPQAGLIIGSSGPSAGANAIIEGLTIYRRPLTDGTYGVRPMNGNQYSNDEINAIWNAGAGRDPQLVTGSEDTCVCVPTNSTQEILASGNGNAWSWPWADNLLDVWGAWDGGLPGTDRAVEFDATDTIINCGSDVDIDDIADAEFTAEAWIRLDGVGEDGTGYIYSKRGTSTVGWRMLYDQTLGIYCGVYCDTIDAYSNSTTAITPDGKWHHVTVHWDDANVGAARVVSIAVDGVWLTSYDNQVAGTGAITSDVAEDLIIGNRSDVAFTFEGAIAWAAISNNDRHTVGTDFIPPRAFPADDANYLASWPMDEGTGATIDNIGNQGGGGSGAANRDGTLANGTWSSIWEQDATPVVPQSLEFDGADTLVNCGSAADIDNLPDGAAVTFEGWVRADSTGEGNVGTFFHKTNTLIARINGINIRFEVGYSVTSIAFNATYPTDSRWHHLAFTYDETGDRKGRIWIDGILIATSDASAGAYNGEAASDLTIGNRSDSSRTWDGSIGWFRISNNVRYTANFVPDARTNPPGLDGNTIRQFNFTDGAGTTLTDATATANATITMGAGQWNNTPDMEIDEPGAAIYGPKGMNFGSDAVNDGIYDEQIVVAEADWVTFPSLSIGESGRARPRIRIYDVSNAADVVIFNGPMFYGTHTGGNASANLIPTVPRWIADALIGGTAYNITDGSSAVISDNSELEAVTALAGGVDDLWDNGDVFVIRFPRGYCERPWMESFCWQVPSQCTLLRVYIENMNGEGVIQFQQVQVLPNLIPNGDHESLTGGNPDIITGWINLGLDPGDTQASSGGGAIIHSGAEAMQWNVGASAEGMYHDIVMATGQFIALSMWGYGTGLSITGFSATRLIDQSTLSTTFDRIQAKGNAWEYLVGVARKGTAGARPIIVGAGATLYSDDISAILLDDVALTVTPASEANSLETGGIRIDGRDQCTQPVAQLRFDAGDIRCNARPRHSTALAAGFGQADEQIFDCYENANNFIRVHRSTNSVFLQFNANGAGVVTGNWNSTGLWDEDEDLPIRAIYGGFGAWLYVNGVLRVQLAGPSIFATDFTLPIHWGYRFDGTLQFDGVIS